MDDIVRYAPFGEVRGGALPTNITDRGFTGHKHNAEIGLIYMNARFYDPSINRFLSADTIVPDPMDPQAFNRFSYGYNNPLRYIDPSGHFSGDAIQAYLQENYENWQEILAQWENDNEWWTILSAAEADDLLLASTATASGGSFFRFLGEGKDVLSGIVYADDPNSMSSADTSLARHFQGITLQNFFEDRWDKTSTYSYGILGTATTYSSEHIHWDALIKKPGTAQMSFLARSSIDAFYLNDDFRNHISYVAGAELFLGGLTMQLIGAPLWVPTAYGLLGIAGPTQFTNAYTTQMGFQADDLQVVIGTHSLFILNDYTITRR